jgi:hypothetical protein
MDPAVRGSKLASGPVASRYGNFFRGEKRTLGEKEVRALARPLVGAATDSPGKPPFPADEEPAVTNAVTARSLALGDCTWTTSRPDAWLTNVDWQRRTLPRHPDQRGTTLGQQKGPAPQGTGPFNASP